MFKKLGPGQNIDRTLILVNICFKKHSIYIYINHPQSLTSKKHDKFNQRLSIFYLYGCHQPPSGLTFPLCFAHGSLYVLKKWPAARTTRK